MNEFANLEATTYEKNAEGNEPSDDGSTSSKVILLTKEAETDRYVPSTAEARSTRKSGGPRTSIGKQKSSKNALKDGIFSEAVVLPGESWSKFNSLLNGFRADFEPQGTTENFLVERLANIVWRQNRLLTAEGAEIRRGREFLESDVRQEAEDAAHRILDFNERGLIRKITNPAVLQECLDLLKRLKARAEACEFRLDDDCREILEKLYGDYRSDLKLATLQWKYMHCLAEAESPRVVEEPLTREECKNVFLYHLDEEVRRLKQLQKKQTQLEANKIKVESLRANVPDAPQLDRLIRCETHLDRMFERTANQLERLQRMRRGQPVPTPLTLNVEV